MCRCGGNRSFLIWAERTPPCPILKCTWRLPTLIFKCNKLGIIFEFTYLIHVIALTSCRLVHTMTQSVRASMRLFGRQTTNFLQTRDRHNFLAISLKLDGPAVIHGGSGESSRRSHTRNYCVTVRFRHSKNPNETNDRREILIKIMCERSIVDPAAETRNDGWHANAANGEKGLAERSLQKPRGSWYHYNGGKIQRYARGISCRCSR